MDDGSFRSRWYRSCTSCPHLCRVNRLEGELGRCGVDAGIRPAAADLHYGEERVLVGRGGSGTVFLSSCNLSCVFCQNFDISHGGVGRGVSQEEFIRLALSLQQRGAENLNLVSPTHQGPALADALLAARRRGLRLPVVYNCGGYESLPFLQELEGLVDIYMPDMKFADEESARNYLGARDYPKHNQAAVREMHRQVGVLRTDALGVAERGLLVRHLVMPRGMADSEAIIDFLCDEISPATHLNIMDQYHPAFRACEYPELSGRVPYSEVERLKDYARSRGMSNLL